MDDENGKSFFQFNPYDIMGYFIPGAVFLIGIVFHTVWFQIETPYAFLHHALPGLTINEKVDMHKEGTNQNDKKLLDETLKKLLIDNENRSLYYYLLPIFLFSLAAYLCGHIIASFSAAFIDKLWMERVFGYPYERLFKGIAHISFLERRKRLFYRGATAFFVIAVLYLAISSPFKLIELCWFIPFLLVLTIKIVLFNVLMQKDIQDPYDIRGTCYRQRRFVDWIWLHVKKPYDWLNIFFNLLFVHAIIKGLLSAFRMLKPFHPKFRELFAKKFNTKFGLDIDKDEIDTDVFWLTYSYVINNSPASARLLQQWLRLYAFARNLSMTFIMLLFYGMIINNVNNICHKENSSYLLWCFITALFAVLFGLRYYYLYYNYFSKYVFRTFLSIVLKEK